MIDPRRLPQPRLAEMKRTLIGGGPMTFYDIEHLWAHLAALIESEHRLREALEDALRLAKQATNGWACYANTEIQHKCISYLHERIDGIVKENAVCPSLGIAVDGHQP